MQSGWDDLLSLEDQFYQEGFALGRADGERAGRAEGRHFGMVKAYEKFVQLGRLHGHAEILQAELVKQSTDESETAAIKPGSDRARKHIEKLLDLTDIENMAPENTEDAVADVDERLKEATSKATLIAKITGRKLLNLDSSSVESTRTDQLEDFRGKTRFDKDAK